MGAGRGASWCTGQARLKRVVGRGMGPLVCSRVRPCLDAAVDSW
jgi:hypothetical protein